MFKSWRPFESGENVVVGVDTSMGQNDYCAAVFLSKTRLDIPLIYHSKVLASEMTPLLHQALEMIFDETGIAPLVAYENNNGGILELTRLNSLNRNNKYRIYEQKPFGNIKDGNPTKIGWTTSAATRPKMLADLKEAIDQQLIKIYSQTFIDELFSFILADKPTGTRGEHEKNAHDDLVFAAAISWQLHLDDRETVNSSNYPIHLLPQFRKNNGRAVGSKWAVR